MKYFLVLSALVISLNVSAQHSFVDQVQKTVAQFIKASEDSDLKTLSALASSKLTYGHSNGKVQNKAEFLESFKTGATDFVKINITEQTIDISGTTAIVRHLFDADTNDNNNPGHVRLKILTVWQKQSGKWILLARQAVKPPM